MHDTHFGLMRATRVPCQAFELLFRDGPPVRTSPSLKIDHDHMHALMWARSLWTGTVPTSKVSPS